MSTETIEFLRDKQCFHIASILPRTPQAFYNGERSDPLAVTRESVPMTVDALIGQGRTGDSLRRLKALKWENRVNRFDITFLPDLRLLSDPFCLITLLLARERPIEVVDRLSDRGKMTTWCGGVVFGIGVWNLMGLAEHFHIVTPDGGFVIGAPTPDVGQDAMWYNEFVRLPDYVVRILAAWSFETNQIPAERIEY